MSRGLERLTDRHGDGNYLDCTLKLTAPAMGLTSGVSSRCRVAGASR